VILVRLDATGWIIPHQIPDIRSPQKVMTMRTRYHTQRSHMKDSLYRLGLLGKDSHGIRISDIIKKLHIRQTRMTFKSRYACSSFATCRSLFDDERTDTDTRYFLLGCWTSQDRDDDVGTIAHVKFSYHLQGKTISMVCNCKRGFVREDHCEAGKSLSASSRLCGEYWWFLSSHKVVSLHVMRT
jgi:hypothetical protein